MSQQMDYNEGYRQGAREYDEREPHQQYGGSYQSYDQPSSSSQAHIPTMGKLSVSPGYENRLRLIFHFVLGIISLITLIPLTAIALAHNSLEGMVLGALAVILINAAFAFASRRSS